MKREGVAITTGWRLRQRALARAQRGGQADPRALPCATCARWMSVSTAGAHSDLPSGRQFELKKLVA
jgi:hypothetical protein